MYPTSLMKVTWMHSVFPSPSLKQFLLSKLAESKSIASYARGILRMMCVIQMDVLFTSYPFIHLNS
jgi:hypothetical protein